MTGKHTPVPWTVGYESLSVEAQTEKGTMKVLDIRGWGHLTGCGTGALGLSFEEGKAVQEANAAFIVRAVNCHDELIAELERLYAAHGNEATRQVLEKAKAKDV